MHIEIAQHINGDNYGQKNINLFTWPLIYMNKTSLLHFGVVKNWCNVVCFFFWMLAVAQFLSIDFTISVNVGCKWGRFVCANCIRLCTCCNASLWLGSQFGGCWSTSSSSTSCSSSKGAPCTLPIIMSSKMPSAVDAMFSCTGIFASFSKMSSSEATSNYSASGSALTNTLCSTENNVRYSYTGRRTAVWFEHEKAILRDNFGGIALSILYSVYCTETLL